MKSRYEDEKISAIPRLIGGHAKTGALDELFAQSHQSRSTFEFLNALEFICQAHNLKPYNAYLVHIQNPFASLVASAAQWRSLHRRDVRPDARPLIILVPFGPVGFVFDVLDTEGDPLSDEVLFWEIPRVYVSSYNVEQLVAKCRDFSISIVADPGIWSLIESPNSSFPLRRPDQPSLGFTTQKSHNDAAYEIRLGNASTIDEIFLELVQQLAPLLCGHHSFFVDEEPWKPRSYLSDEAKTVEASAVRSIIGARMGLMSPWEARTTLFDNGYELVPPGVSVETILTVSGRILDMLR